MRETGFTENHEKKKNAERTKKSRSYRSYNVNHRNDGFVLADLRILNSCMGMRASSSPIIGKKTIFDEAKRVRPLRVLGRGEGWRRAAAVPYGFDTRHCLAYYSGEKGSQRIEDVRMLSIDPAPYPPTTTTFTSSQAHTS